MDSNEFGYADQTESMPNYQTTYANFITNDKKKLALALLGVGAVFLTLYAMRRKK